MNEMEVKKRKKTEGMKVEDRKMDGMEVEGRKKMNGMEDRKMNVEKNRMLKTTPMPNIRCGSRRRRLPVELLDEVARASRANAFVLWLIFESYGRAFSVYLARKLKKMVNWIFVKK